jgi:prevent-host-death family protein
MPQIGIRQLNNETSEIIRSVRDEGVEYVVTYHGRPVAVIRPVETASYGADDILMMATDVFAGLDDAEQAEIDGLIRRREGFFGEIPDADLGRSTPICMYAGA